MEKDILLKRLFSIRSHCSAALLSTSIRAVPPLATFTPIFGARILPLDTTEVGVSAHNKSERKAKVPLLSCRVYVLAAVIALVKSPVNVFATLRSPNVPSRNVLRAKFVCADARIISPVPTPSVPFCATRLK